MKIVKGDTVYVRSGKDAARHNRLQEELGIKDQDQFQAARAKMSMPEQIETANRRPGVRGRVIRVLPKEGKVVVEGVNMVTKHQKPRGAAGAAAVQQGGRISMEAPIPISRVMLVCTSCGKPTRVGLRSRTEERTTFTGTKMKLVHDRVCKQCKQDIPRPTDERK